LGKGREGTEGAERQKRRERYLKVRTLGANQGPKR
jgi:hypothetical protein